MAPKAASKKGQYIPPFLYHTDTQKLHTVTAFRREQMGTCQQHQAPATFRLWKAFGAMRACADSIIYSAHRRQAQCQSQPGREICPERRTSPPRSPPLHSSNPYISRPTRRKPVKSASQPPSTDPRRSNSPARPNTRANPSRMRLAWITTKSSSTL